MPAVTRRTLFTTGAALGAAGAAGVGGWAVAPGGFKYRLKDRFGLNPAPYVPDVPEGRLQVEQLSSDAMGSVSLFTAVPHGYGDGAGLPVVVVLHGASATVDDFRSFGFGKFVTAAARDGFPMVLTGTDDGPNGWLATGIRDPPRMLADELPGWLADRGFAAERRALWGWSRGGYGALNFAVRAPGWAKALALFSPALGTDDPVLDDLGGLRELPVGLWCGKDDAFLDGTQALGESLPAPPEVTTTGNGGHTRQYWNSQTMPMLRWVGGHLS